MTHQMKGTRAMKVTDPELGEIAEASTLVPVSTYMGRDRHTGQEQRKVTWHAIAMSGQETLCKISLGSIGPAGSGATLEDPKRVASKIVFTCKDCERLTELGAYDMPGTGQHTSFKGLVADAEAKIVEIIGRR